MRRLLIHPPFADPTQPYLSLPTLKAYLRARHLDAEVIDLNIEAAHYLFKAETVEDLAHQLGLRFLKLNHSASLSFDEQREYRALAEARQKIEQVLCADVSPVEVFQTRELFFDPGNACRGPIRHCNGVQRALPRLLAGGRRAGYNKRRF